MHTTISHRGQATLTPGAMDPRERLDRLRMFSPDQLTAGLTWLAGYDPKTFDVVLDAVEPCTDDEARETRDEAEPFCAECGAAIGIFLRLGLDWRHYRGDGTTIGQIELFDAGHTPVVAWRPANDVIAGQ